MAKENRGYLTIFSKEIRLLIIQRDQTPNWVKRLQAKIILTALIYLFEVSRRVKALTLFVRSVFDGPGHQEIRTNK